MTLTTQSICLWAEDGHLCLVIPLLPATSSELSIGWWMRCTVVTSSLCGDGVTDARVTMPTVQCVVPSHGVALDTDLGVNNNTLTLIWGHVPSVNCRAWNEGYPKVRGEGFQPGEGPSTNLRINLFQALVHSVQCLPQHFCNILSSGNCVRWCAMFRKH